MRFAEIVKGTRQDIPVELPKFDGQPEDSPPLKCVVRALNGLEEEQVLASARRRAKSLGVDNPEPGEPLYELAQMCELIAVAYLDPDSPANARVPFFDGGSDQIRQWFSRESIVYLHEVQQHYQDQVAPTVAKLEPMQWAEGLAVLGGDDEKKALDFWCRCRPGLRLSYTRFTAKLSLTLQTLRSGIGSSSEEDSKNSPSSTPETSGAEKQPKKNSPNNN